MNQLEILREIFAICQKHDFKIEKITVPRCEYGDLAGMLNASKGFSQGTIGYFAPFGQVIIERGPCRDHVPVVYDEMDRVVSWGGDRIISPSFFKYRCLHCRQEMEPNTWKEIK
jgi:hypothetical protein